MTRNTVESYYISMLPLSRKLRRNTRVESRGRKTVNRCCFRSIPRFHPHGRVISAANSNFTFPRAKFVCFVASSPPPPPSLFANPPPLPLPTNFCRLNGRIYIVASLQPTLPPLPLPTSCVLSIISRDNRFRGTKILNFLAREFLRNRSAGHG